MGRLYVWRLHRLPQWSSDAASWRGMAIAVRHKEGQREAVIEFPPGPQPRFGAPQLKASQIARNLRGESHRLRSLLTAGWEPLSRGKTINIVVDAAGG